MASRIVNILTQASSFDLMTIDEAKLFLGLPIADMSADAQLQLFISVNSATVSRLCNRIFGREEVLEEWRELNCGNRVFPSHWPVYQADLISVESPKGTVADPSTYELEEQSGKIEFSGQWVEPVVVHYWGGYNLPEEVPEPLKHAVALLNIQSRLQASLGLMAGIRMLSHKEARVAYHDPSRILQAAMGQATGKGTESALMQILNHYIHFEV